MKKFSIIIPMFNAEKYIEYAIDSIINQTVNFKENIDLILVDDGSTDRTSKICSKYVRQFPNNVQYTYTKNSGPGNARNIGINLTKPTTEIIGFIDADDYISKNSLFEVEKFFNKHPSIQLAVIPLYHFEKTDTPHNLNYRFTEGTRIIDITKEYRNIHFHIGGCFFKANNFHIDKTLRFNPTLKFWEDALLINTFLLWNKKYGVVSEAKYFYRKREDNSSLVNSAWFQKTRYTKFLESSYIPIINESIKLYGRILPYVQFLLVYHMRLYLFPKNNGVIYDVLNEQEQIVFFQKFVEILKKLDSNFILEQDMPYFYKHYLINLKKHGWPYRNSLSPNFKQTVTIKKIKFYGTYWFIEGQYKSNEYIMKEDDRLFITNKNNQIIYLPAKKLPANTRTIWGTVVRDQQHSGFNATIPSNIYIFNFGLETPQKRYTLNKVNLYRILLGKVRKLFLFKGRRA